MKQPIYATVLAYGLAAILLLSACFLGSGCTSQHLQPEVRASIAQLEADQDAAEAAGDEVRVAEIEAEIVRLETEGAEALTHGILGPLSPFIPGGPLIEGALASLAWLGFKRPRQHFVRILKGLNPMDSEVKPVDAVKSIAAAVGLIHSSEDSAQAFDPEAPANAKTSKAKAKA